jgi:hypothetical protein
VTAGGGALELQVSKASLHAEEQEQEEGDERADLGDLLNVKAILPTPAA